MRSLHAITTAVVGCLLRAPAALAAPKDPEDTAVDLSSGSAPAADAGGGGSIARTIVGLAVVLGVIYGLHWVLKQIKSSKETKAVAGTGLESLATLPLGPNRALHLVRAGAEIVLLGSSEHGVTPIRRYSEQEARALGLIEDGATTLASLESEAPKGFLDALRAKTVVR
jgi:flagellar protein FliO/FliZ